MVVTSGTITKAGAFNGATTAFPLTGLQFLDDADLLVHFITAGAATEQTLGDDYTVTGDGRIGAATLNVPLLSQSGFTSYHVLRRTTLKQDVAFLPGAGAPAAEQERQHDRLVMGVQDLAGDVARLETRLLRAPDGESFAELAATAARIDKVLTFDETGAPELLAKGSFPPGPRGLPGSGNTIGLQVEDFCTVDTPAGNAAGLLALSEAINELGGGVVVDFPCGKEYVVGDQEFVSPAVGVYYNWISASHDENEAVYFLHLDGCTKPLVINFNGSSIKLLAGQRYGVFNDDGSAMANSAGYSGPGVATPCHAILKATNCTAAITINDPVLNGNKENLLIGGFFGDSGRQIECTGIHLENCSGGVIINNPDVHDFPFDGLHIDGVAADDAALGEQVVVTGGSGFCRNGRNGLSIVGGAGMRFSNTKFNDQGRAAANSEAAGSVATAPCSGVDCEAEGGKAIRDIVFDQCEFSNNTSTGFVADSGTDTKRVSFRDCKLIGTTSTPAYFNRPGIVVSGGLIAGSVTSTWGGTTGGIKPTEATQFDGVFFTTDVAYSPTGSLENVNNLFIEAPGAHVAYRRCQFDYNLSGVSANGNTDGNLFEDCFIHARAGTLTMSGRYRGRNTFREDAGAAINVPGGALYVAGRSNLGHSETPWTFVDSAGTATTYPATVDEVGNCLWSETNGNSDVTLAAGVNGMVQYFDTALTADRTVPLSTTGAKRGQEFLIVRTASGAFNLNVVGSTTKALVQDRTARFRFNGAAWRLIGASSL